jgi:putative transposase
VVRPQHPQTKPEEQADAVEGPKALRNNLKRLERFSPVVEEAQRLVQPQESGGMVAKLHARIANIRRHALRKLTPRITAGFTSIGIEELNVNGKLANGTQASAIADVGMFEFLRQLEYGVTMRGCHFGVADRFFQASDARHAGRLSECAHRVA